MSWCVVLMLALGHLVSIAAVPIAGGPRMPLEGIGPPDRWTPPRPHTDARFTIFPTLGPRGERGLWLPPSSALPIRFTVEQGVIDRYGFEEVEAAVEIWNRVPGSRFGAVIERVVDTDHDERFRDGINRIYVDRRSCGGRYLARAHMWPGDLVVRDGRAVRYIAEFDLGLCDRLQPEDLERVFRHELLHMAGLGHLCDPGEDCHRPGMDADNRCRIMATRLDECQRPSDGDRDGLVYLHPQLHRAGGADGIASAASVALATHPVPRSALSVVLTPHEAPLELQALAATLAGHLRIPHLLVAEDCTTGQDGAAIDRVLALAGEAILVGPVAEGCRASLEGAWAILTEPLASQDDVVARSLDELEAPEHLVVAPAPDGDQHTPIAAVAGPAAVTLEAPLVVLDDDGSAAVVLEALEAAETIRQVIVVGDADLVDTATAAEIAGAGVDVRRLDVTDAGDAAVGLSRLGEVAPATGVVVAIVAVGAPEHAIPAIGIAAASGAILLPIDPELRGDHATLLRDRVSRGAVVGDQRSISAARQMALSRLIDGVALE